MTLEKSYALTRVYDHRNRLLNTEYAVSGYQGDSEPRTIVSANVYNEAGLLKTKYLHSQGGLAFMQKIDYKYNIRGWLTAINEPSSEFSEGDRFGMRLWYNKKPDDSEGLFNGNIAATAWSTPNYKNLQYVYTYNKLNRLTQAKFWGEGFRDTTNYFKVNYSYDANGNILRLERYGLNDSPRLDNITYGYYDDTNVLKYSSDPNGDAPYIDDFIGTYSGTGVYYEYDPNGNMTRDDYKGLAVEYNDLNLPEELDFGSNNKILYFYNSTGEKMLRAIDSDSVADINTYYFGPFVHEGTDGSSSSLKYIITPEGRILNKGTDTSPIWDWEYYLKDHLGNVRVVIAPTEEAGYSAVQQETHYYPYGMRMSQLSNSANSTNDWLFSSKQLESSFDLGWYSFGARNNYDPALIIWRSIDPRAEKYYSLSPFSYCANNPMIYIDLEGKDIFYTNGLEIVDVKRTSDNFHTVVQEGTDEIWFKTSDLKVSLKIKDQTTFQLGLVFAGMLKDSPYEPIWREKYNVEGFDWGEIDLEAEYLNREYRQNTSDDNARLRLFKLISEYIEKLWKLYQNENDNGQNQQQNENNNTPEQDENNSPDQDPDEEDKDAK